MALPIGRMAYQRWDDADDEVNNEMAKLQKCEKTIENKKKKKLTDWLTLLLRAEPRKRNIEIVRCHDWRAREMSLQGICWVEKCFADSIEPNVDGDVGAVCL